MSLRRRPIAFLDILLNHPVGIEERTDRADRLFHYFQPATRQAVARPRIELRRNLLLQEIVNRPALHFVLVSQVGIFFTRPDRPTVVLSVAFGPPTVQNAEVDAAIATNLHAARSRRFERPARVVEPDVDSLYQMASDVDVVVLDKDYATAKFRPPGNVQDLGDQ